MSTRRSLVWNCDLHGGTEVLGDKSGQWHLPPHMIYIGCSVITLPFKMTVMRLTSLFKQNVFIHFDLQNKIYIYCHKRKLLRLQFND
jgi:hypothetical protein